MTRLVRDFRRTIKFPEISEVRIAFDLHQRRFSKPPQCPLSVDPHPVYVCMCRLPEWICSSVQWLQINCYITGPALPAPNSTAFWLLVWEHYARAQTEAVFWLRHVTSGVWFSTEKQFDLQLFNPRHIHYVDRAKSSNVLPFPPLGRSDTEIFADKLTMVVAPVHSSVKTEAN